MVNKLLIGIGLAVQLIVNGGIIVLGLASMDWSFLTKEILFAGAFISLNLFSLILLLVGAFSSGD